MQSNDYEVACFVNVSDVYGGVSSASTVVKIIPPQDTSAATKIAQQQLSDAIDSGDSNLVSQIVGAVTNSLNTVDCTVPYKCSVLHRQNCSATPKTCGPCLTGYVGVNGDSNMKCTSLSVNTRRLMLQQQYDTINSCSRDNDCLFYESCVGGQCVPTPKPCPNDCSGLGVCEYFNVNNQPINNCTAINPYCTAICNCTAGSYGSDCSLTASQYNTTYRLREKLCSSIYSTIALQDLSTDVIKSRMSLIANILQDITQISDKALIQCSTSLIYTIEADPVLVGQLDLAIYSIKALNNVRLYILLLIVVITIIILHSIYCFRFYKNVTIFLLTLW